MTRAWAPLVALQHFRWEAGPARWPGLSLSPAWKLRCGCLRWRMSTWMKCRALGKPMQLLQAVWRAGLVV